MATETKEPEIHDIDLTHKLLQIAFHSKDDAALRATHAAARAKLASLNKVIQDELDKQREAARKTAEAAAAKAAEEATAAKRKAEDETAAAAKKAAEEAAKKPKAAAVAFA